MSPQRRGGLSSTDALRATGATDPGRRRGRRLHLRGWRYVLELHEAGLLPHPEVIAGNRLALLVGSDLAAEIGGVHDLVRPGLRLLVPREASDPFGQYTVELFARAGLTEAIAEKRRRGDISEELGGLRDTLASKGVDAVVIYASMLKAFSAAGTAVLLSAPYDLNDRIVFGAGAIVRDGQAHPATECCVACLIGPQRQTPLIEAEYLPRSHATRGRKDQSSRPGVA